LYQILNRHYFSMLFLVPTSGSPRDLLAFPIKDYSADQWMEVAVRFHIPA